MANITRIKAGEPSRPKSKDTKAKDSKAAKKTLKSKALAEPANQSVDQVDKSVEIAKRDIDRKLKKQQKTKKTFFLFVPFVALGRYLRDAWRELRQVHWPSAKLTWKMVLAVFIYTLIFVAFLVALDLLFDWLFSIILR